MSLHGTWLVNSAAHMFGHRHYNPAIPPAQLWSLSLVGCGEGYHNYHHNFPQDYQANENGEGFNLARVWIDWMAAIGLAYNLRVTSKTVVEKSKANALEHPAYRKYTPWF